MPAPAADDALPRLAFELTALLRADGHLCNVMTHISSGDWRAVEQAIVAILTPRARPAKLSKLARNLLDLLCDDLGVAGRAMRPFVFQAIGRVAGARGKGAPRSQGERTAPGARPPILQLVSRPRRPRASGAPRGPSPSIRSY